MVTVYVAEFEHRRPLLLEVEGTKETRSQWYVDAASMKEVMGTCYYLARRVPKDAQSRIATTNRAAAIDWLKEKQRLAIWTWSGNTRSHAGIWNACYL